MNMTITAFTTEHPILEKKEKYGEDNIKMLNNYTRETLCSFAGKNAGICYMNGDYPSIENEGIEKSLKRFNLTIKSTHHSIADHCFVTVVFENVPKFFAMIMNSFQFYNTSEKSARYTKMKNLSSVEEELYYKWYDNINKELIIKYNIDEDQANKIAQENARYFISIFSPSTTFSYTTSIRQWNYIYIWFKRFLDERNVVNITISDFITKIVDECMTPFIDWFETTALYIDTFEEPKMREIDFIYQLYGRRYFENTRYGNSDAYFDSYKVNYEVSFAALAQLQRHRTIKYVINDFKCCKDQFYIPDIVKENDNLLNEWVSDMKRVSYLYPQGLMVQVAEFGTIDNFLLKCDERLCGRAQLETMNNVKEILKRFYYSKGMSRYSHDKILEWFDNGRIKAKCEMRPGGCYDIGCIHGPLHATERLF